MDIFRLKVSLMYDKRTYRSIEILGDQTLHELHKAIYHAFDRHDEHLYSFFLTGQATKNQRVIYASPEITHPMNLEESSVFEESEKQNSQKTKISSLELEEGETLHYLFDFGDEWWHEITVLKIIGAKAKTGYPKVIDKKGVSPAQYPD